MIVEQIPTDVVLDKLHDMYMEGLPTPPACRSSNFSFGA